LDGKSHVIVGLFATGVTMYATKNDAMTIPLVVGAISSLVPDLDHQNSSLTKKVSAPLRVFFSFLFLSVSLFILIKTGNLVSTGSWVYAIALCLGFILCVSWLRNIKSILFLTGILISLIGWMFFYGSWSVVCIGLFIAVASRLKHRGLTHSVYFLGFWTGISYLLQKDIGVSGICLSGFIGYFSHLLGDNFLTKRRIKWL